MSASPTLFVIDDDPTAREAVRRLADSVDIPTREYPSVEAFLAEYQGEAGCVVTDYRMSGMTGLELQEELSRRGHTLPVIIITSFANTSLTVKAMKGGAVTLLDKPYDDDELWQAIRNAFARDRELREQRQTDEEVRRRLESLTRKEQLVLDRILAGKANKEMAAELDVSLRTIENRRRSVFQKLGAGSVAELVALVLKHQPDPDESDQPGT